MYNDCLTCLVVCKLFYFLQEWDNRHRQWQATGGSDIRVEKNCIYSDIKSAVKSLARPGRKQANVSVRMAWISFRALLCRKKKPC